VYLCSCTVTVILNFLIRFSKYIQILNFVKIPPEREGIVPCGRTDGGRKVQRNKHENNSRSPPFLDAPRNGYFDKNLLRNIFLPVSRFCLVVWMDRRQISTRISKQGSQWSGTLYFRYTYENFSTTFYCLLNESRAQIQWELRSYDIRLGNNSLEVIGG